MDVARARVKRGFRLAKATVFGVRPQRNMQAVCAAAIRFDVDSLWITYRPPPVGGVSDLLDLPTPRRKL